MHISYCPLWNTLKERGMRKENLRIAAGLNTNTIVNMGKGKNISMETLLHICKALNYSILDVIELEENELFTEKTNNNNMSAYDEFSKQIIRFFEGRILHWSAYRAFQ